MVVTPKQTRVAFRCPTCGDTVVGLVGRFALSADFLRLKCPCGESHLDIRMRRDKKIEFSVPCVFCKKNHSYVLSPSLVFDRELFLLNCPYANMDIAALGDTEEVEREMARTGQELSRLLTDLEAEGLSDIQPHDMNDDEILPDPQIYDTARFLIRELEADGAIDCPCHSGSYDLRFADGGIQVFCPDCGASHLLRMESTQMSTELVNIDSITLR